VGGVARAIVTAHMLVNVIYVGVALRVLTELGTAAHAARDEPRPGRP
jgi:hypothetical protein